jgi:hypothetical protein
VCRRHGQAAASPARRSCCAGAFRRCGGVAARHLPAAREDRSPILDPAVGPIGDRRGSRRGRRRLRGQRAIVGPAPAGQHYRAAGGGPHGIDQTHSRVRREHGRLRIEARNARPGRASPIRENQPGRCFSVDLFSFRAASGISIVLRLTSDFRQIWASR